MNLKELAKKSSKHGYAPYSKVKVGCALIANNNKIYTGANIENASYGLTICAERVAIFAAIHDGASSIKEMCIYSSKNYPPCGACLQVISEFANKNLKITILGKNKEQIFTLERLLPLVFDLRDRTKNMC